MMLKCHIIIRYSFCMRHINLLPPDSLPEEKCFDLFYAAPPELEDVDDIC